MELFKILGKIVVEDEEARQAIQNTAGEAEGAQDRMSGAFKKIGAAVATYFAADKIIEFGKEVVNTAAEIDAETSAFGQIMGNYSEQAAEKVGKIAYATGIVATRLNPYMTSMTAKFKGLGYDVADATDYASRGLNLAADAAAFWDVSLDDSMGHLNSFINGSYEGGEAIGLFANDTQLAMYAVKTGLIGATKDWANLDEATKQATRLDYAENMFKQSGATGQAAREADQYANVQANLNEKWRQFKGEIGQPLLQNLVLPAMQKLSGLVSVLSGGFERLKTWVSENRETVEKWKTVFLAAMYVLLPVLAGLTTGMLAYKGIVFATTAVEKAAAIAKGIHAVATGGLTKAQLAAKLAQMGLNSAMLMSPITWIIALIAALVAAFVILWKKCDGFREFWINLWDGIKNIVGVVVNWIKENWQAMLLFLVSPLAGIFKYCYDHFDGFRTFVDSTFNKIKSAATTAWNAIKHAITHPIETAKNIIKSQLDKIKSFFDKLKLKFPNIKLPHFSIKGKFSLDPPSVPKLNIDWYAKAMHNAMLLNSPTIFGMNPAGQFMGGGEAGQEVVSGASTLMNMIQTAVRNENSTTAYYLERLLAILAEYFPEIIEKLDKEIVLDDGTLVGRLAPKIDRELGSINKLRLRGT